MTRWKSKELFGHAWENEILFYELEKDKQCESMFICQFLQSSAEILPYREQNCNKIPSENFFKKNSNVQGFL